MTDYLSAPSRPDIEFLEAPEIPTVVQKVTDHPVSEMATVFDGTFTALFPLLQDRGITPVGPPFSLHHRIPDETATFEVGIPVDRPLEETVTTDTGIVLAPSTLPAGDVATVSHVGPYDDLGDAWGGFMERVADGGGSPRLPFWEVYVTEPTPDTDPATLRTDLYTVVSGVGTGTGEV